jgi:hypothetical protein
MVKKKSKKGVKASQKVVKSDSENFWFRKRRGLFSPDLGYGWIPITWQGYIAVLLLIAVNAFSVFYFGLVSGEEESVLKSLTVFALSLLAFVIIAMNKTRGSKDDL